MQRISSVILQHKKEAGSILEIGSAEGYHTELLAKDFPGAAIRAVEISPTALGRAKDRLKPYANVSFVNDDICSYGKTLSKDSFDLILWCESAYYLSAYSSFRSIVELLACLCMSLSDSGLLCMGHIFGLSADKNETNIRNIEKNALLNILESRLALIQRQEYEDYKEETGSTFEYEIWLFRNAGE